MTAKINSENRNKKRKIDLSKINRIAKAALREIGRSGAEVNIVFISNRKIRALNRAYFGIDSSTDVISFPAGEDEYARGAFKNKDFLGDIAISSDKAAQNARAYKTAFGEEIALYVIHGILHLAGFRDGTKKERSRMREKEDEIFQKVRRHV